MYPSSSSSSSHGSMGHSGSGGGGGLTRYGSAPGSVLTTAVDSAVGGGARDFSGLASSHHSAIGPSRYYSESAGKAVAAANYFRELPEDKSTASTTTLQRSYNFQDLAIGSSGGGCGPASTSASPLVRHSSSPARFLNQLAAAAGDNTGFKISMGIGSSHHHGVPERLNSQLSFTRQETHHLSQVAEEDEEDVIDDDNNNKNNSRHRKSPTHSYNATSAAGSFGVGSWSQEDDNNHHHHSLTFSSQAAAGGSSWPSNKDNNHSSSVMFSLTPTKRAKNVNGADLAMETQLHFGMAQSALEMASMDRYMQIPEDSVPCKIRAKRGCATHPRSIAERERRTRISGKLKKLQDLVPNMDKQTSYADMLDLAVQHIKSLQVKVQEMNKELEHCTCGCKKTK